MADPPPSAAPGPTGPSGPTGRGAPSGPAAPLATGARQVRRQFMLSRVDGVPLAETFLVSAVVTVIIIRAYLSATGYPQLGGSGLHIAHVLWGGLLMLVGIFTMLLRLGRPALRLGAFVAGVGFGFFIDEIGKFVTSDVNYFFEPAIAMIYVIFVAIALVLAVVRRRITVDPRTALANAMWLYDQAVTDAAAADARRECLALLRIADQHDPLVPVMRAAVQRADATLTAPPTRWQRLRLRAYRGYARLAAKRWFAPALITVFALSAITSLVAAGFAVAHPGEITVPDWIQAVAALVAAVLVIVGLLALRRSRVAAYAWFERAVLVDILIGEVFAFYRQPTTALAGLVIDILLLLALRLAIRAEGGRRDAGHHLRVPPTGL